MMHGVVVRARAKPVSGGLLQPRLALGGFVFDAVKPEGGR